VYAYCISTVYDRTIDTVVTVIWHNVVVFFVGDCSVDVLAYSASGSNCLGHPAGFVKLNGVAAWRGSWCGIYPNDRGVTMLLVDPVTCSVKRFGRYDTYTEAYNAGELAKYLQTADHGDIVVGVSADEPSRNLNRALPALREIGVEVGDVQRRGSFCFVAQKGFPTKTVLRKVLTEAESSANPARFNATISGIKFVAVSLTLNILLTNLPLLLLHYSM